MVARDHGVRNHHHSVRTAIYPMGSVAIPDWGYLYGGVFFSLRLDRPILSVARGRVLPAEFRVAHFHGVRSDHPRLDPAQDAELHSDLAVRRAHLGTAGVGVQL